MKRGLRTVALALVFLSTLALACATRPSSAARAAPGAEAAQVTPELRARVDALLVQGAAAQDPQRWRALGAGAFTPLSEATDDVKRPLEQRARAVAALAWVTVQDGRPETRLGSLAADARADLPLRAAAMRAMVQREGPGSVAQLKPLLGDDQPEVRVAAAAALGLVGSEDARKSLEDRLAEEENVSVREVLQQNLGKAQP